MEEIPCLDLKKDDFNGKVVGRGYVEFLGNREELQWLIKIN
jgi:hypothetical protein